MLGSAEFDCQIWLLESQICSATPTISMGLSSNLSMLSTLLLPFYASTRFTNSMPKLCISTIKFESPMQCIAPLHRKSKMCPIRTPVLFPSGYYSALLPSTVPSSSLCARLIKIFRETACLANGRTSTFPGSLAILDSMHEALAKHHEIDDIFVKSTAPRKCSEESVAEYNYGSMEEIGTRGCLMTPLNFSYRCPVYRTTAINVLL